MKKDAVAQWMLRLAREHQELFGRGGGWKIAAMREPQVASHGTTVYRIDGPNIRVKFFGRMPGRTGTTCSPTSWAPAGWA